jgi:NADPH:quinone reductase-like Zn-dependent oxidoreductase
VIDTSCKATIVTFMPKAVQFDLVARGEPEVPITGVFALSDVRDAFREVEQRHTCGKLVLRP